MLADPVIFYSTYLIAYHKILVDHLITFYDYIIEGITFLSRLSRFRESAHLQFLSLL